MITLYLCDIFLLGRKKVKCLETAYEDLVETFYDVLRNHFIQSGLFMWDIRLLLVNWADFTHVLHIFYKTGIMMIVLTLYN